MKNVLRAVAAVLAAPVAIAMFAGVQYWNVYLTYAIFLVALGHAIVLGLPLALIFLKLRWNHAAAALLAGFAIGFLPAAVYFGASGPADFSSVNGVVTSIGGQRTLAGWLGIAKVAAWFGSFGALGGAAAWAVWHASTRWPSACAWLLVTAVAAGVFGFLPRVVLDTSCHNPYRPGVTVVDTKVTGEIRLEPERWPELARLFREFAGERGWSFRDRSYPVGDETNGHGTVQVSMCNREGTLIAAKGNAWSPTPDSTDVPAVTITVMQINEGENWSKPAREMVRAIDTRWPGRLEFRNLAGEKIDRPEFLDLPGKDDDASGEAGGEG